MKPLLLICAVLLLFGIAELPIGYYTFLRIVVTFGAVLVLISENKEGINLWIITFGLIAILFNPIFPIYLHDKNIWHIIDLITGIIFLIKSFNLKLK